MTLVDNLVLQKQHEQLGLEVPNIYFSGSLKTCYGCHEHGWRRSDFKEKKKRFGFKKNSWKRPQVSVENTQFCLRCS